MSFNDAYKYTSIIPLTIPIKIIEIDQMHSHFYVRTKIGQIIIYLYRIYDAISLEETRAIRNCAAKERDVKRDLVRLRFSLSDE